MISIKNEEEIKKMRRGGRILASILKELKETTRPGIKRSELDELARKLCDEYDVKPSFLGYGGYPAAVCVSVNDEVVHGLPNESVIIGGDLVSLDMGVLYEGFHTDSAVSFICGYGAREAEELIRVTEQSFYSGLKLVKNGVRLGDVSAAIQKEGERYGFGVVRMLVGHGIGRKIHEDPHVPNFGTPGTGPVLKTGMTLAIEPMLNRGSFEVALAPDKWTYKTYDGSLSAHFEHTILVTDNGYEILTEA